MKKIILVGIPHHGNKGDAGIVYGEHEFIKEYFKDYELINVAQENAVDVIDDIEKICTKGDIIALHGGGNMGVEYFLIERIRREYITRFVNNKIIIFPQTIYYKENETEEFEKSIRIYSKHPDLTIMAREKTSYETMKNGYTKSKIIFTPDIVTFLNKTEESYNREGALILLREDRERVLSDEKKDSIEQILKEHYSKIEFSDTVIKAPIEDENRENILNELWDQLKSAEIVVTDRLHGMIFCAITETPCIVFGNYNHKVESSFKWFEDLGYIKFIETEEELQRAIEELRDVKDIKYPDKFYYYFKNLQLL